MHTDAYILRQAKKGSLLREKQAEAYRANDIMSFINFCTTEAKLLKSVKELNTHFSIPQRLIPKKKEKSKEIAKKIDKILLKHLKKKENEKEEFQQVPEKNPNKTFLSWLW